ncbi:MAG: iron transporter substrate-binding protein [Homoserinimonas sp.]|nr:iron transporter substrate-binding protein [Homoserinimonas sp.]
MHQIIRATAVLAAAGLALTGCATTTADAAPTANVEHTTVTVEHAQGSTEVALNPETVLTFDMASLDTLDTLGIDVAGVPQANIPSYLDQYSGADYLNIGTLFEPDYEAVAAADADLIIVAGRSAAVYEELAKIAPTIDLTVDNTDYLPSFAERAATLGHIFDKTAEVETALAKIESTIDKARSVTADAGTGLLIMTNGGEVSAFGADSRFGWLFTELGLTPAVDNVDAATHGDPISFEFILEANPDWLFVIDRDSALGTTDGESAEQILDNDIVGKTTAWTSGQVAYLDSTDWYIVMSGLTAVDNMVNSVIDTLS